MESIEENQKYSATGSYRKSNSFIPRENLKDNNNTVK